MPIREAHELNLKPPPRCPVCGVGITAIGRRQPVAVDLEGHPYCRTHGHIVASEYDAVMAEYERIRHAQMRLIEEAEQHGIAPSREDMEKIQAEWHNPG